MNPEEQFARLKRDDDRWENTSFGRAAGAASAERRRIPLWGQLTIGIAAGLIVGLVVTLGVTGLRDDALPPANTPTPTSVPGSVADDGYVMNRPFAEHFDFDSTTPEPLAAVGDAGSAPWAVIEADPDAASLSIAYVSSGNFDKCGVHKGVDVVETDSSVTITLVTDVVAADEPCTTLLRLGVGTVALGKPLGDRMLFHGRLTHPWDEVASPLLTVDPALVVPEVGATCGDFFYDQTQAGFEDSGLKLWPVEGYNNNPDGYAGEILDSVAEGAGEGSWTSGNVVQYGGIPCRWAMNETFLEFDFGPITAEQSAYQQERLAAEGWLVDPDSLYPLLYKDGVNGGYAFGEAWWAFTSNQAGLGGFLLYELTQTSPHPEAFAIDTGSESTTFDPPADPDAYITTAGYGDLKIGQRVPSTTTLVEWHPDDCYDGRWATTGATFDGDPVVVRTTTNAKTDPILWMSFYSPEIATKSGARVGMSYGDLIELFPDAQLVSVNSATLVVVADALGKVVFEIEEDEVQVIHVIAADAEPFNSLHGDAYGRCYGA